MTNKLNNALLFSFMLANLLLLGFTKINTDCKAVKNGTFHFYKDNGRYHSIVIRKDSLQTEVNLNTGDSTFWRIRWISDCQFACTYLSGSAIKSPEEIDFYKRSILKFNINKTSDLYYTFDAMLTFDNNTKSFSDTMWLNKK